MQSKWDNIYSQKTLEPTASLVLTENQHLLPSQGTALDLACGQGGNARLLAEAGLDVLAWDISSVAIEQLRDFTALNSLSIDAQVRDVLESPPKANSLDVLVVSFFLDRALFPKLIEALKPSGLVFYQTYCQDKVSELGPKNPEFLLADNELLALFSPMKIRVYREESLLGNQQKGWRNQALLVAEKGLS
ncbi:MAG: methyltransferase domain-containing protein [Methylococcaceae bacterium]|nr:methyltransferase domain-containing protein [Methylococcaceae bacterium]